MDFIGICIAPIFTILGVIIGTFLSYFWQSRLNKQLRDWDLDDQKRERKRNKYSKLSDNLNYFFKSELMALKDKRVKLLLGTYALSEDELSERRKEREAQLTKMAVEFDFSFNPDLEKNWIDALIEYKEKSKVAFFEQNDSELVDEAIQAAIRMNREMQKRLEAQINDT